MSDRLRTIIALFESDGGYKWSEAEQAHAQEKWELLSSENKAFLTELSEEDLENVCIGEVRGGEIESDDMWLVKGVWVRLPPGVESFLTDIWEFKS